MHNWPFLRPFITAFVTTVLLLGAVTYGASLLLVSPPDDRFLTPFMELIMAPGWSCSWEGTEGVCRKGRAEDGSLDRSSIVVFAAKYRNAFDSFGCYEQHLRTPRHNTDPDGTEFSSKLVHLNMRQIGDYLWMDGLLFESEVPSFNTQYLATVTSRIGILVTFSVRHDQYEERLAEIESMVGRMRIYEAGGTAPYRIGDPANRCAGAPVVDKYAAAGETSGAE